MFIKIFYCGEWNYLPEASRLEDELNNSFDDVRIELVKSRGGDFRVIVDEKTIFDKRAMAGDEARFPNDAEISSIISKNISKN